MAEDVIRADMDEPGLYLVARFSQVQRARRVYGERPIGPFLALRDVVCGGRIDNQLRTDIVHDELLHRGPVANVQRVHIDSVEIRVGVNLAQFRTELAACANHHDFHRINLLVERAYRTSVENECAPGHVRGRIMSPPGAFCNSWRKTAPAPASARPVSGRGRRRTGIWPRGR